MIEPETLWADDFEAFFQARSEALVKLMNQVMGKPVDGEPDVEQGASFSQDWTDEKAV